MQLFRSDFRPDPMTSRLSNLGDRIANMDLEWGNYPRQFFDVEDFDAIRDITGQLSEVHWTEAVAVVWKAYHQFEKQSERQSMLTTVKTSSGVTNDSYIRGTYCESNTVLDKCREWLVKQLGSYLCSHEWEVEEVSDHWDPQGYPRYKAVQLTRSKCTRCSQHRDSWKRWNNEW